MSTAGAAETVDSGDVTGLGKRGAIDVPMCRWWDGAIERVLGVDPRKNSVSGSWVVASAETAVCGVVCVAASRSKVGLGWGAAGELKSGCNARRTMQRRAA